MSKALAAFLRTATPQERKQAAEGAGTSVGYLYTLAGGHRRAGLQLALGIEKATKELHRRRRALPLVTVEELANCALREVA